MIVRSCLTPVECQEYLHLDIDMIEWYKEEGFDSWYDGLMEDWPYYQAGDCSACLWELSVTYFDEYGNEHEVDVKPKG